MAAPKRTDATDQPASIDPLIALVADDMARVNEEILSRAVSDVEMIPKVAGHLIASGGKRLRPMLTLASAQMCGYSAQDHIKLATSVEFMHTATLLHDDVVDESNMRRGKAAARILWGNEASVLVGDFLLGQAFKMMVETGSLEALAVLSNAAAIIAEGEVLQLGAARDIETDEALYLKIINAKTAALFSAACQVGGIIANRPSAEIAALAEFGTQLGIAFQLIDDALDYSGDPQKLGKSVGDDFREGKITLPVVFSLKNADQDGRAFWLRTLQDRDQRDGDFERALTLLEACDAIGATVAQAARAGDAAKQALAMFNDTPHRAALMQAVDFCIERAH